MVSCRSITINIRVWCVMVLRCKQTPREHIPNTQFYQKKILNNNKIINLTTNTIVSR